MKHVWFAILFFAAFSGYLSADEPAAPPDAAILLISSEELREAWQPFADWKTSLGRRTSIVTTESIAEDFEGDDLQEKIRVCVRKHIDEMGTTAVVLGGDSEGEGGIVPDRDTIHETMWGKDSDIPTDIFYLSETDWDADGDGIFGEWEEDRDAISYPDGSVGIGRIPVRTAEDVAAYTAKVIAYESAYPTGDFAHQIVYTCTVGAAYNKLKTSWTEHLSKVWPDGTARQFFADFTVWDEKKPGDFALSPEHIVDLVNRKEVGKFHFHGHGLRHCWVLEEHEQFGYDQVKKLTNKDACPIITTVSCFTGQFDSKRDPSIAESMLRKPDGGAVIVVAPAREGKPHFHDPKKDFPRMVKEGKPDGTTLTMARFWSNGLGDNLDAGRALMTTKAALAEDARKSATYHMCLCELNLLGDPTLDLRASSPRPVSANFPESILPIAQTVVVETDAPGARVCLWKGEEVFSVESCDLEGNAKVKIAPGSAGPMSLTIAGPGLNAFVGTIEVEREKITGGIKR